jgi:hypothetical protein
MGGVAAEIVGLRIHNKGEKGGGPHRSTCFLSPSLLAFT